MPRSFRSPALSIAAPPALSTAAPSALFIVSPGKTPDEKLAREMAAIMALYGQCGNETPPIAKRTQLIADLELPPPKNETMLS
jgi:hypothetical protein